jgi:hypothetical protein
MDQEQAVSDGQRDAGQPAPEKAPDVLPAPTGGGGPDSLGLGIETANIANHFTKHRDQVTEHREKVATLTDAAVAAVQGLLASSDPKTQEKGLKAYLEIQQISHAQDMESWRFTQDMSKQHDEHTQVMGGHTQGGEGWLGNTKDLT